MAHQAIRIGTGHDVNAPTVPTISASVLSATSARVSLTEGSSDASGIGEYRLERSPNGSSGWSQIAAGASIFPYDDTNLDPETAYYYRARAADAASVPNVSGYSGTANITTPAANEWTNPNPWLADFSPAGTPKSISFAQFVPPGSSNYRLHESSAPLPAGVTLDSANKLLVDDGEEGAIADVTGVLIEDYTPGGGGGDAAADWASRISGAGVLWAQRFQSASDVTRWQTSTPMAGQTFEAGRGIISGDGCMRQTVAQRASPGDGNAIAWRRPIQPQPGDINQPGVPVGPGTSAIDQWNSALMHGIMHPDYNGVPVGSPARTGIMLGSELYLQYRVRFSPGHFASGMPYAKMGYVTCNYQDPSQEYVWRSTGYLTNKSVPTHYTSWEQMFNSGLEEPQSNGPDLGQKQPGYTNACTYNNQSGCWTWPENEWVTVMHRIRPGHQYGSTTLSSSANNGSRDTLIEWFVAPQGQTTWTRIFSKSDFIWAFDNGSQNGSDPSGRHPYGFTWMQFNPFTGGVQWAAQPAATWNEFDQVICSLQPIPCPQA